MLSYHNSGSYQRKLFQSVLEKCHTPEGGCCSFRAASEAARSSLNSARVYPTNLNRQLGKEGRDCSGNVNFSTEKSDQKLRARGKL